MFISAVYLHAYNILPYNKIINNTHIFNNYKLYALKIIEIKP